MMFDLVTFGEAMVRLTAPGHMRLEQARHLEVSVGGAEWNVAVNVARLGHKTSWVSRLVDNWSGRLIVNEARMHGVDTSHVVWEPFDGVGRVRNGFYYLELGAGPRAAAVTYDRGHSAISQMTADMVDWKALLGDCRWVHTTGITPALSETLAQTAIEVFRLAGELGVQTSYDLNYRSKLWSPEQAQKVTVEVMPYVKVLIGNEEDFETSLGIRAEGTDCDFTKLDPSSYKVVADKVMSRFSNIELVGTTLRQAKTGLINDWQAVLYDGKEFCVSRLYENLELVDRVGGGDSFSSGVISSVLAGRSIRETCEFAASYSALAHTFPGDINWATRDEALKVMKSSGARIAR